MKKTISLIFAAVVCAFAFLTSSCSESAPVISAQAELTSATVTSATVTLNTQGLIEYAYVVKADASEASDPAVIFLEGTTGVLVDGTNEVVINGLEGNSNYVAIFAFRQSETAFFKDLVIVDLATPDYEESLTILGLYHDGFSVHYKIPEEVKTRGNAIRYGIGSLPIHMMQKLSYGNCDADFLLQNGQRHFVNDTTIIFRDYNVYELDENGDYVLDEWTGEPITLHTPFTPGEPLIFLAGEFAWDPEHYWGPGWYTAMFDYDAYYEAMWGGGGFDPWSLRTRTVEVDDEGLDEDQYWTGWFSRKHVVLEQPMPLDCNVDFQYDMKATKGTVRITPDENVWQYCIYILPDYEYEMMLPYLDNNTDYLQWFTASYPAMAYFGAQTLEGPVELALEDMIWVEPETDYHLLLTALGNENGTTQKFYHEKFSTTGKTLPAPTVQVTAIANPSGQESPYEVWYNVKCTSKNAVSGKYAANYDSEWAIMLNRGYTYNNIVAMGNALTDADIEAINSDAGMDLMFSSLPDMTTLLGVMLYNEEETANEISENSGMASAKTIREPAKDPVQSSLFTDLLGDWTMSAPTQVWNYNTGVYDDTGVQTCKVTISDGFTLPETLTDDVYATYADATGQSREEVDALYADLKNEVKIFNENLKSQNRLLCQGFGYEADDAWLEYYTLNTPYDLFVSPTYNGYNNRSIIQDCGPKWYLEVLPDGTLVSPVNAARQYPLCFAKYYTLYLAGVSVTPENTGYITNWEDNSDVLFPCTVASDKNQVTVGALTYNGYPYYMTGVYTNYTGVVTTDRMINGPISLTKGWTEPNVPDAAPAAKRASAAPAFTWNPANGVALKSGSAVLRRTPMSATAPVYQKVTYKHRELEDALARMRKAYVYER
ncbi:MAG: hypothetical protein ACI3ZP_09815 [Candidatus Cryptobacteroides sp.]